MPTTGRKSTVSRGSKPTRGRAAGIGGQVHGTVRLGRRTKDLVKGLRSTDIAVIDHLNLDRIAAEELVARGVRAVINLAPSSDGSYPNVGPLTLVRAGIPLIDAVGAPLFDELKDGEPIVVNGAKILCRGRLIAEGKLLEADELAARLDDLRRRIDGALHDFAENTVNHIREEAELVSGTIAFPDVQTDFRDQHVLIVVRGTDHVKDLRALRAYIRDVRPVLVGVDGGVQAILDEGHRPDMILGDMDSASESALACGAELLVHGYADGSAPGSERLTELGLAHLIVPAAGTSQDVAMLLAHEKGATLIVAVGAQFNLVEFLDKRRGGMSSTFLTRLRIGELLVDAKGVSRLYNPGPTVTQMLWFGAAFAVLLVIVVISTPPLERLADLIWLKLRILFGAA